jgi:hypothetical protein
VDKLSIQNEMIQFDRKNREFYDSLTDEERKKFSNYLMIRWGSSIQGSAELQNYYLQSSNHYVNRHFFDINRHPRLQWLCATAVSPGLGAQRHQWIAPKKKEAGASGIRKQIAELFPYLKDDEVELMSKINTKKDIDTYLKQLGQEAKK